MAVPAMKALVASHPAAGGGSGIAPDAVTGLVAWWKADATLYQDAARTTAASSDGDPVGSWTDSSGNGFHASGSSTDRPTIQTGEINGLPVVRFDGNDVLEASVGAAPKPFTVLAVIRSPADASKRPILGSAGGSTYLVFAQTSTDALTLEKSNTAVIGTSSGTVSDGSAHVVAASYSGAGAYAFYIDGSASGTGTNDQTFTGTIMRVGGNQAERLPSGYDVAEIIVYDNVISSGDLDGVTAHLQAKYGL